MKKKWLFLLIAFLMAISGWSQTATVSIGTGTSISSSAPIPGYFGNHFSAQIFSPYEMTRSGVISSVGLELGSVTSGTGRHIKIYMKEVTDTTLASSQIIGNLLEGATLVYDSTGFECTASTWKDFILSTQFAYSGTGSLLVMYLGEGCTTSGGCTVYCKYASTPTGKGFTKCADGSPISQTISLSNSNTYRYNSRFVLADIPADYCYPISKLVDSNITATSADIFWHANGSATSWQVEYTNASDAAWTNAVTQVVTDTAFQAINLNPNTQYIFRVKSLCNGGSNESGYQTISFKTLCAALTSTDLPYTENFESYTTGSSSFPSCWKKISTGDYPYVYTYLGSKSLYFNPTTSGNTNIAILPQLDTTTIQLNTLRLRMKFTPYLASHVNNIIVGVMTDPSDSNTFNAIDTLEVTGFDDTWTDHMVSFVNYTGYGSYVAIKSTKTRVHIDDIVLEQIPDCAEPTHLVASNATTSSIDLSWTPGNASDGTWTIYYKKASSVDFDSITVSENPYNLSGLEPFNAYNWYVKTNCGTDSLYGNVSTFTLACGATLSQFPFIENFDSYGIGSGKNYPNCWQRINTNTGATQYPYINSTSNSGIGGLYLYSSSSSTYSIAILPEIDTLAYPIHTLTVAGNAKGASTYKLILGAMTDTAVVSSFTPIDTIVGNSSNWTPFEFDLANYSGQGRWIAFKMQSSTTSSASMYLDDLTIKITPTCPIVKDLTTNYVGTDNVKLNWNYVTYNGTGYEIAYQEADSANFDPAAATIITDTAAAPSYNVTGLTIGSTYTFAVRQNCGGAWSNYLTIKTLSNATQIPYSCDFETEELRNGWSLSNNGITNKFFIGQAVQITDSIDGHSLYVGTSIDSNTYNNNVYSVATAARLIESNGSNGYILKFNARCAGEKGWDYLKVFVTDEDTNYLSSSDEDVYFAEKTYNTNALTLKDLTDASLTNTYWSTGTDSVYVHQIEAKIPYLGDAGTVKKLIFVWKNDAATGNNPPISVDKIEITNDPCVVPTISLSNLSSTGATINVIGNPSIASWTLYYKDTTSTADYTSVALTQNNYDLTLTEQTVYKAFVVNACSGNVFDTSNVLIFKTPCTPISTLPYIESFEDSTTLGCLTFAQSSSSYPWKIVPTGSYPTVNTPADGTKMLYFNSYNATNGNWAAVITRPLTFSSNLFVKYNQYRSTNGSTKMNEGVYVYVNSTPDTNGATLLGFTRNYRSTTGWDTIRYVYHATSEETKYFIFVGYSEFGYNTYIDNIQISEAPACLFVTNPVATNMTTTSASLSWTPGETTDNSWRVYYKATTDSVWDSVDATTNPYELTALTPGTTYQYYVKTNCGTSLSEASPIASFQTNCLAITNNDLPYTENFDTYSTGTTAYPNCWQRINTYNPSSNNYPYISTTHNSGVGSLYFYAGVVNSMNIAISPMIDNTVEMNKLRTKFYYKSTNPTDKLFVGVISTPTDLSTFTPIDTIKAISTGTWNEYEVSFSTYTGTARYIAFKNEYTTTSCYAYVDDVVIDSIPDCFHPTLLSASPAETSATLSWVNGHATDNSWRVYYKATTDSVWDSVDATTNPYPLNGLSSGTPYQWYVKTNCGGTLTEPSNVSTFVTNCAIISTLPYTEDFDGWSTGTNAYPVCWSRVYNTSTAYPYINSTGYSGNCLYFTTSSLATNYNIAVSPQIDTTALPLNTLSVSFRYKAGSTSSKIVLGVMSNPTNASTFVPLDTIINSTTSTWYFKDIPLTSYTGHGASYIALKHIGTSTSVTGYVDDFAINTTPACPNTYDLSVVNSTSDSITIAWDTTNNGGQGYVVSYGLADGFTPDNGTQVTVQNSPYSIGGLTEATNYSISVRKICTGSNYGAWSNIVTVNTYSNTPAPMPYTCDFENTAERYSWRLSNSTCKNRWSFGTAVDASPITGNSMYVSNDNGVSNNYDISSTSVVVATRKIASSGAGSYTLSFDTRVGGESSYDYLKIFVNNTLMNGSTTIPTFAGSSYSQDGALQFANGNYYYNNVSKPDTVIHHSIVIPSQGDATNTFNVSFVWKNDGSFGTQHPIAIDNISITPISCSASADLATNNITANSVDLTWTSDAGNYIVYYKKATDSTYTAVATTSNTFSITTLDASTAYNVYTRNICSSNDTSAKSNVVTFTTSCLPITTLPWNEGFEGITSANELPPCMSKTSSGVETYLASTTYNRSARTGSKFAAFKWDADDYLFTPGFQLVAGATYNFSFYYKADGKDGFGPLAARLCSGQTSADTVSTIGIQVDTFTNTTYQEYNGTFTVGSDDVYYIGIYCEGDGEPWYASIDDLSLTLVSMPCIAPTNVTSSEITQTSAKISWTSSASASSWQVKLGDNGSVIDTNVTNYTFNNLTAGTNYIAYVRSKCSDTTYSDWASVSFTTLNDVVIVTDSISTQEASNVEATTATLNGKIERMGSTVSNVTVGFVLSTQNDPELTTAGVINNPVTYTDGMTTFNYTASGLQSATAYFYRAYITNNGTTTYGVSKTFTTKSGLLEVDNNRMKVTIYPNPTEGNTTLSIEGLKENAKVIMTDVQGRVVSSQAMTAGQKTLTISRNNLRAGVYYVRVITDNQTRTEKLIIK